MARDDKNKKKNGRRRGRGQGEGTFLIQKNMKPPTNKQTMKELNVINQLQQSVEPKDIRVQRTSASSLCKHFAAHLEAIV